MIANHDPREVRYNIFQALQYLADWLSGNGCVALPAVLQNQSGEDVFVRIMDDLATTERSRWELWAEIFHGRVSRDDFESILAQEVDFIRHDRSTPTKRVQVRWDDTTVVSHCNPTAATVGLRSQSRGVCHRTAPTFYLRRCPYIGRPWATAQKSAQENTNF